MAPSRRNTRRTTQPFAPKPRSSHVQNQSSSSKNSEFGSSAPGHEEVLEAVRSLYADELKPFGRILRKRVAEAAAQRAGISVPLREGVDSLPDVDIRHLRHVCETSKVLNVQPEEGGDWSAVLAGHPERFVNVYSPVDVYPTELWAEASAYFESLSGDNMFLPGGRYSCAQALMARNLPFLADRSLGQVCHIVQLAISQKKILGYFNGAVVPYSRSQSMVKEHCAVWKVSCSSAQSQPNAAAPPLPPANWDVARACLKEILESASTAQGPGMVPLSNVKRLFRSRFHLELSETMLGHSKLSELLQDVRFRDVCSVQLQGHGYIVVQKRSAAGSVAVAPPLPLAQVAPGPATPASRKSTISLADWLPEGSHQVRNSMGWPQEGNSPTAHPSLLGPPPPPSAPAPAAIGTGLPQRLSVSPSRRVGAGRTTPGASASTRCPSALAPSGPAKGIGVDGSLAPDHFGLLSPQAMTGTPILSGPTDGGATESTADGSSEEDGASPGLTTASQSIMTAGRSPTRSPERVDRLSPTYCASPSHGCEPGDRITKAVSPSCHGGLKSTMAPSSLSPVPQSPTHPMALSPIEGSRDLSPAAPGSPSNSAAGSRIVMGLTQMSVAEHPQRTRRSDDPMKVHVDPARSMSPLRSRRPTGLDRAITKPPGLSSTDNMPTELATDGTVPLESSVGDTLLQAASEPVSPVKSNLRRNRPSELEKVGPEHALWEATCQALSMLPQPDASPVHRRASEQEDDSPTGTRSPAFVASPVLTASPSPKYRRCPFEGPADGPGKSPAGGSMDLQAKASSSGAVLRLSELL